MLGAGAEAGFEARRDADQAHGIRFGDAVPVSQV
jgi:hypothetical protein